MKKYFLLAAVALTAASCINDENENSVATSGEVISLTASMATETTRAATTEDLQDTHFYTGEEVNVVAVAGDVTKRAIYTAAAADGTKNTLSIKAEQTALTWPTSGTVNLQAFHPSSVDTSTDEFAVQTDQSDAANYRASDLMFSDKKENTAKTSDAIGFVFTHKLSKIIVNLTKGEGVTSEELAAAEVKVKAVKTATISSGNATAKTGEEPVSITLGTGTSTAAIIVPQTVTASAEAPYSLISVKVGDYTPEFKLVANKTFEKEKMYTYTLKVGMSSITLESTSISDWTEGNSAEEQDEKEVTI